MPEPHRTVGFVDVLATRSTGLVRIGLDIFFIDLDLDRIGNLRRDVDRRKTGLPFSVSVKRADANQTVHAGFAL